MLKSEKTYRQITTPFEVTTSSLDAADGKQFFFTQTDGENEAEEQTLQRNQISEERDRM